MTILLTIILVIAFLYLFFKSRIKFLAPLFILSLITLAIIQIYFSIEKFNQLNYYGLINLLMAFMLFIQFCYELNDHLNENNINK